MVIFYGLQITRFFKLLSQIFCNKTYTTWQLIEKICCRYLYHWINPTLVTQSLELSHCIHNSISNFLTGKTDFSPIFMHYWKILFANICLFLYKSHLFLNYFTTKDSRIGGKMHDLSHYESWNQIMNLQIMNLEYIIISFKYPNILLWLSLSVKIIKLFMAWWLF